MTPADDEVWVKQSMYEATRRAYEMAIDALDVVAMDGPGEVSNSQLAAMARIVARSARAIHEEGQPLWRP